MNANLQSPIPAARGITSEGWAAIAGAVGSAILLAKKLLSTKGGKSEHISRAEFYAELMALKDDMHKDHLVLLEKLDAIHLALLDKLDLNHRALLAEVERQGTASTRSKPAWPAWTSAQRSNEAKAFPQKITKETKV